MSSSEEIQAIFEDDINRMTRDVAVRRGTKALLEGASGMHTFKLIDHPRGDGNTVTNFNLPTRSDEN